jgi:hypothetical protein
MKFPGTYYAYSVLLAAFGQNARAIPRGPDADRCGERVDRVFCSADGSSAGSAAPPRRRRFTIMALDRWVLGVFAHATHFALLPALAGLLFLLRAEESRAWQYEPPRVRCSASPC